MSISELLDLTDDNSFSEEKVIECILRYEGRVQEAAPIFDIRGKKLEHLARDIAKHLGMYLRDLNMMKSLVKMLETRKSRVEAGAMKNLQKGPRAFNATEQRMLIAGEKSVTELQTVINAASKVAADLEAIVEAIRMLGWQINSIVKLRVASLEDVEI